MTNEIIRNFVDSTFVFNPSLRQVDSVRVKQCYAAYRKFCLENDVRNPLRKSEFKAALKAHPGVIVSRAAYGDVLEYWFWKDEVR